MNQKFYKCEHCGQIVFMMKEENAPLMCCGTKMKEIIAGTTEASLEKHIPEYNVERNVVKVNVGSVEHPMTQDHFIEWISLQTKNGNQIKFLSPEIKPYAEFFIDEQDQIEAVYAYCNLHGLWKS